ncbi:amidohydrolase [Bacillus sp. JCM 19034]|uniref:amidohydrolase family protein n=1 Tax=Bacillus sp. JCM 19034 TaxID=1481928 RepID=UPI00078404DE|nr:amidohydrolase family protein [Bacillus sp. JCM 19034]
MRIDAHQHYWQVDRGDYDWITPDMSALYRDFLPADLEPILKKHNIDYTIVVQAAPTLEETEFMLQLSENVDTIIGVVGWLNLENDNYKEQYEKFCKHPKFVGFRVMIQEMEDASTILSEQYIKALTYFADCDVPIDLLVEHEQLEVLVRLLEKIPHLRGVIDHIGKPNIASGEMDNWKRSMNKLASFEQMYCKLSGMITEADYHSWQTHEFVPYIDFIMNTFGVNRVMFGSDWPVCHLAGTYDDVVNILNNALSNSLLDEDEKLLFGYNAKVFYKL